MLPEIIAKQIVVSDVSFSEAFSFALANGYNVDFSLTPQYLLFSHFNPDYHYRKEEYSIEALTFCFGTLYLISTIEGLKGTMIEYAE